MSYFNLKGRQESDHLRWAFRHRLRWAFPCGTLRERHRTMPAAEASLPKKSINRQLQRRPLILLLVAFAWSLTMGWLLSSAAYSRTPNTTIGTVDVIPVQYQLGQQLYIENCSTCHIALPPAVFPTQTWKNLLQDTEHYGKTLTPLVDPPRTLVWKYLSTFSRVQLKDEETPYRLGKSRYFRALHPGIKLPNPVQMGSCVTCHPGAKDYNFRSLSAEWDQK